MSLLLLGCGSTGMGFPEPAVGACSPTSGDSTTTSLTVTGVDFRDGAVVTFSGSGITVVSTTFVSDTELTVDVTIDSDGYWGLRDLTVTNPDTQAATLTDAFEIMMTSPLALANTNLYFTPAEGVIVGGARQFTAGDKASLQIADASISPANALDPLLSDWSVCGWVKFDSVGATYDWISGKGGLNAGDTGVSVFRYTTTLYARFCSGSTQYQATATVAANVWYFVVFACDRDGNAYLYLNASASSPVDISGAAAVSINNAKAYEVGGYGSENYYCTGCLSCVSVYSKALSAPEVTALYNLGNPIYYGGLSTAQKVSLVSMWNLNEAGAAGQGATDQHGSNDLTFTASEMLSNTGFETRTGITGASLLATDKAHLEIADNAALDLDTGDFVINVNVLRTTATEQVIVSKYEDADNYWCLKFNSSHYVQFYAKAGGNVIIDMISSTTACSSTTTKYHIQVAVDRSNATNCKIYVNGVSQAFSLSPSSPELITNGDFSAGTDWTSTWDGVGAGISGGTLNLISAGDGDPSVVTAYQALAAALVSGRQYSLTSTTTFNSGSILGISVSGGTDFTAAPYSTFAEAGSGTVTYPFTATGAHTHLHFYRANAAAVDFDVDNVSLKQNLFLLDSTTSLGNTGKLYVGQLGDGTLYFNGRIAMLGIGKPGDASAAAVTTSLAVVDGTDGLGQYYGEQAAGDKTALAWVAFWDMTEAVGNRVDKASGSSLVLAEAFGELVTNGTFATNDTTGWTNGAGGLAFDTVDASTGACHLVSDGDPALRTFYQAVTTGVGRSYTFAGSFTRASGNLYLGYYSSGGDPKGLAATLTATNASYSATFTSTDAAGQYEILAAIAAMDWTVDDLSLKAASIPCASDADVFGSWTEATAGTSTIEVDTTTYQAGVLAARIREDASGSAASLAQSILTVGNTYNYTLQSRGTGAGLTYRVYAGTTTADETADNGSFGEETGTLACAGTAVFKIESLAMTSGVLHLDTVSCKAASIPAANGPSTAIASDSISTAHGVLTGFSATQANQNWTTDVPAAIGSGYALTFDGATNKITLGSAVTIGTTHTFAVWVKSAFAAEQIFGGVTGTGYCFFMNAGAIYYNNGSAFVTVAHTADATAWHHYACVRVGTSVTFYYDGSPLGTVQTLGSNDAWTPLYIGGASNDAYDMTGSLDDARIYNVALSPAQVAQLYAGTEATGATPVAKWTFDDGPQATPTDGDPVLGWVSNEGSRYQSWQQTAANRPIYNLSVAGLNNKPAIYFDGSNDLLRIASAMLTDTDGELWLVWLTADDVATEQAIFSSADEATATKFFRAGINATKARLNRNDGGTADTLDGNTVLTTTTAYVFRFASNGTTTTAEVLGASQTLTETAGSNTGKWIGDTSARDSTVIGGSNANNTPALWAKGYLAEVIHISAPLSALELAQLEALLASEYGVVFA